MILNNAPGVRPVQPLAPTAAPPPVVAAPTAPTLVGDAVTGVEVLGTTFAAGSSAPPAPPKDSSIIEDHHGVMIADPFRPLERLDAPATTGWWKAQNERTQALLSSVAPARNAAVRWHEEIRNYTREGMTSTFGDSSFFTKQAGLEAQPTYLVRTGPTSAEPRVLIDPKTLSADGTVAVKTMTPNPAGTLVAYTVSEAGSDQQTLRFRDVATSTDVGEQVPGLRFSETTWDTDGAGVYYSKPLPPEEGGDRHFGLYRHAMGADPAADTLVFKRTDVPDSFVDGFRLQPDDPALFVTVSSGSNSENGLSILRPGDAAPIELLAPRTASLTPFHRVGDTVYAVTDLEAPRNRIVAIDVNEPATTNWKTVVGEGDDPGNQLRYGMVADGKLLVGRSVEGADAIEVRSLADGSKQGDVPLPVASSIAFGQVTPKSKQIELSIGGYLSPGARYSYDVATNQLTFTKKSDIPHDLTEIADVSREYATSKDGTKVPMWVIRPKDLPKDGTAPTILYGYGGFNNSLAPGFSYNIAHWVEQGGVYAVANLRGGGEFGKEWYDGGRLANKQNVFDDFAASAQRLVEQGYTTPKKLAISGASNGGLLTAVTSQQHPELFGAVISGVPVTDMLRFHTANYGAAWKSDYGDPEVKADFDTSIKYSPLHNVRPASEVAYPPTLVLTGDHDDRVAPWHAFKWTAERQDKGQIDNTYLRVDERAGHGGGKPTRKVIDEAADTYAFLVRALDLKR